MADTPAPKGIIDRLKSLLPAGGEAGAPHPRWPHRTHRWLDPKVPLHAWRCRVDLGDAPEALRVIAAESDGRVDEAAIAEVRDAMETDPDPASFRFGARDAFRQVWIGVSRDDSGGVRIFLLSEAQHVARVEAALSVAGFQDPGKRAEYDRLRRFLVGVWEWRGTNGSLTAHVERHEAAVIAARLDRLVTDPQSPLLEVLRGLRMRARDLLREVEAVDPATVAKADAWLASRGAPTLTELRGTFGS
ncbi:MAG TPA: hypothetical protein VLT61_14460 [Anaeromyxobacteraceae bacterium]|nr:hypothetical protein [Anaeromyxobacteraceae bacterium]